MSSIRWYVIQTKPTSESDVAKHLKNADIETFIPMIKVAVRGRRRPSSRTRSLFPSYIFAHVDLSNATTHHDIKYTRGVRRILGDGKTPVSLPDEVIDIIRERMNDSGVIEQGVTMKKGDSVIIKAGPFKDLIGILERPVSASGRVNVLLKIIKQRVRCEFYMVDVEKITP